MTRTKTYEENSRRLGAHVSIAGGISTSFERAVEIGCGAFQIFSKNQSQWRGKQLGDDEVAAYHAERRRTNLGPVIIHDSYLINLCAPDRVILRKSLHAFADEIIRADRLGVPYLNFHPGSHLGRGEKWGIRKIAGSLNSIIGQNPGSRVTLLLESTAGQGTNLGYRFEHLREIIDMIDAGERMGVCIDTAHIFAGGYDIRGESAYEKTMQELNETIGWDRVKVFHLNDSKRELGSRVDRHENIGKGYIGLKAFELLVNDPRHAGKPMILETPGGGKYFKKNLALLRELIKE